VIYRSRLNPKINRNFEVFTPTDVLAAITQHIPDKEARGGSATTAGTPTRCALSASAVCRRSSLSAARTFPTAARAPIRALVGPYPARLAREPARCPVCQNPMRVIAVIDDPCLVRKILRHLCAWHGPPARGSPPGAPGAYS
jgi:hypothetical protein